jgi:P-type Ca2+ transporter type 2A
MEQAFLSSPTQVLKHFQVTEDTGLSSKQVSASRAKHGSNGNKPSIFNTTSCF